MSEEIKGISPISFAISLFIGMLATMVITTWLFHNIYDWEQIEANHVRLAELEDRAAVYDTMAEVGVGIWCELAVHYDWLEDEDVAKANEIIESGVHERPTIIEQTIGTDSCADNPGLCANPNRTPTTVCNTEGDLETCITY